MFKQLLIESGLEALKKWLENPKRDRLREVLVAEKMQRTIADIFAAYIRLIDEDEAK